MFFDAPPPRPEIPPPPSVVLSKFYRGVKWTFITACSFIFKHVINRPLGGLIARKLFRLGSYFFASNWGQAREENAWFPPWMQDMLGRNVHNVAEEHAAQWGREHAGIIGASLVFSGLTALFLFMEWLVPKICAALMRAPKGICNGICSFVAKKQREIAARSFEKARQDAITRFNQGREEHKQRFDSVLKAFAVSSPQAAQEEFSPTSSSFYTVALTAFQVQRQRDLQETGHASSVSSRLRYSGSSSHDQ